jgi:hypothetical protein
MKRHGIRQFAVLILRHSNLKPLFYHARRRAGEPS